MSINAISSVSLYEYYYKINKDEQVKDESPIARQMREYGLNPTDNEALNIALLKKAKESKEENEKQTTDVPYESRPWADIMYQLNISFNKDPKDDIADIKKELAILSKGLDDEELNKEISDLEQRVENMYVGFMNRNVKSFDNSLSLANQLNNISMLNQVSLF